jgi:hypothetical protein
MVQASMTGVEPEADVQGSLPNVADVPLPDSCAAAKRSVYSITSSARARSVGGTVRLSAMAVAKLMTSSNFGRLHQPAGRLASRR